MRTQEERMNNVKTLVLMAGLMGLFLLAGQLLGRIAGLLARAGPRQRLQLHHVLLLRPAGAPDVRGAGGDRGQQAPELYRMVDRLRQRAGLPMPVVAVAPHEQPNAFATGRSPSTRWSR